MTIEQTKDGQSLRRPVVAAVLAAFCLLAAARPDLARAAAPDARQDAFCGQVVDADGKPLAGATVAVLDSRGQVAAWAKTDAQGHYTVAAPVTLLNLPSPHHHSLLSRVGHGVVQVVSLPVKAVVAAAGVVQTLDPVGTLKAAVVGAAVGDPAPLAAKAVGDAKGLAAASAQGARERAAQAVVDGTPKGAPVRKNGQPGPGEVALLISAPQCKEFRGPAGAYWVVPAAGSGAAGAQAWLDTVRLASSSGGKVSETQDLAIRLSDPGLDPALPTAGAAIHLSVRVQAPPDATLKVRVFAREQKSRRVAELMPQTGGVYAGTLTLDPKGPTGDTTVTIAALNGTAPGLTEGGRAAAPPSMVSGLKAMDAGKPYPFDPRVTAGANRLDLKMTVLDPHRETAPAAPAPAPAAPAPAPAH